jgi:hypothetical protein
MFFKKKVKLDKRPDEIGDSLTGITIGAALIFLCILFWISFIVSIILIPIKIFFTIHPYETTFEFVKRCISDDYEIRKSFTKLTKKMFCGF